jgi:gamma-glutamylputrescine oxidase
VVLLEGYRVGSGASGRNGGVLGMGQRKDQDAARALARRRHRARLWGGAGGQRPGPQRIAVYAIDCDLKDGVLHAAHRRATCVATGSYVDLLAERYDYHRCRKVDGAEMAACWAWTPTMAATSTWVPATCIR